MGIYFDNGSTSYILSKKVGKIVEATEFGRYAGALGAALLAKEKSQKKR